MATSLSQLTVSQRRVYDEFLEMASDFIEPTHKEYYLLQWLNDNKFDAKKAADMFKESMQWRQKHGIDDIQESLRLPKYYKERLDGKGLVGFDKEGCPVWIFPIGWLDCKGMMLSTNIEDIVLQLIRIIEQSRIEEERQTSITGRVICKKIMILDAEHADYSVMAWKTTWKLAAKAFAAIGQNYPDSLKYLYLINTPSFFPPVYKAMKHLLYESVRKTVKMYGKNKSEWQQALLEEIDPSQLPVHWGGTCVDPDGDPTCPSKVITKFEFPKTMYTKSVSQLGIKGMKTVYVDSGSSHQLDVEVKRDGSKLRWKIYSDATEFRIKIHRRVADGLREVDSVELAECYHTLVEGETTTLEAGKYVMVFDNSYFKLRGRTVSYHLAEIQSLSPTI